MKIKNLSGQTITISKSAKLTPEHLQAIKFACLSPEIHGYIHPMDLSANQKKQVLKYAMEEAEKYRSGHSMQYTILRDVVKRLHGL